VTYLESGVFHTCAALDDGTARCWGDNTDGQLGTGDTTGESSTPAVVQRPEVLGSVSEVGTGSAHSCALFDSGDVACWGDDTFGQLGSGTGSQQIGGFTVTGLTGVRSISAGSSHTCAVLTDGTARCWGSGLSGKLGDGTTTNRPTPTPVVLHR
jgi:alpha-tubulin suppressor-like RCC1 family protein